MLRELAVQNLALIEDVRVELQPGFCAWTGETGAGKSLLLGALGLLLGERGSIDLLRSGADELRVTGRFELTAPELTSEIESLLGQKSEQDEIILSRRLNRAGRSQAYANDQPVALSTLKQVGNLLVDIHGQRESESLLQPSFQLKILDAFGHLEAPRQDYMTVAQRVRELRQKLAALLSQRENRQRELALIRFEKAELDQAELKAGELAGLMKERERLANAQSLTAFAAAGYGRLYEADESIVEQLGKVQREAEAWMHLDAALTELAQKLEGIYTEVSDLAHTLREMGQRWEADPTRIDEVEARLQLLRKLETKYRKPIEELVHYRCSLDELEVRLQRQEDNLSGLEMELGKAYSQLRQTADELTRQRKRAAGKLAAQTQHELACLGMGEARLEAVLQPIPLGDDPLHSEVPTWGAEQLELTLAANVGEAALPLRKVVSGGELSRTMLALKTVVTGHDRHSTLVFDEIDANVGGRLGDVLGQKLASLGQQHQVICVTHLPQVASYARHHWTIRKSRRGNRTVTRITHLDEAERLEELASMLRGEARGETTRQEAAAMLATARRRW